MRNTRRALIFLLSLALMLGALLALTACKGKECKHEWTEATCTEAKTCKLCGETEGEVLGHTGGTATCAANAVCARCGMAYGEKGSHIFTAATCKAPKACKFCNLTQGEALGHADTDIDHLCDRCGVKLCRDDDKDHYCDFGCTAPLSLHEDATKDHTCDICGARGVGPHTDSDGDLACDWCQGMMRISEGLEFVSNGDGTCYLSGIGSFANADLVIPSVSPAGDTVTAIAAEIECDNFKSITITAKGTIMFDKEAVTKEQLVEKLSQLKASGSKNELLLRADGSRSYRDVIELMALIRNCGFADVILVTQPEDKQ